MTAKLRAVGWSVLVLAALVLGLLVALEVAARF
jgi:hypothetical protein